MRCWSPPISPASVVSSAQAMVCGGSTHDETCATSRAPRFLGILGGGK
jgi:hypothetical protein